MNVMMRWEKYSPDSSERVIPSPPLEIIQKTLLVETICIDG
jgi:hypothetical protein